MRRKGQKAEVRNACLIVDGSTLAILLEKHQDEVGPAKAAVHRPLVLSALG